MKLVCALFSVFYSVVLTASAEEIPRKQGFIDVPGGPVWYETMGGGENAALLILHGGPGWYSCGYQTLAPLGDDRSVVRYDQLGSGRSGRPKDTTLWNIDRFAAELDVVRKELGLEEVHLLGHSWGASLAAYYVLKTEPKGVRSLILSSPLISTERWTEDAERLRSELPKDVQQVLAQHENDETTDSDAYKKASEEFYARFVTRGSAVEEFDCTDVAWNPAIYRQMWGPTEFYASGTLRDFDLTAELDQIEIPTLFIAGEFDEARPETITEFAAAVPGAQVEIIKDVAHLTYNRAPSRYRQIVRSFIESAETEQPSRRP